MTAEEASRKRFGNKKAFFIGLFVLVVAIIAAATLWNVALKTVFGDNVFVVDGKQYSKNEVERYSKYFIQTGLSKEAASKRVYELIKSKTTFNKINFDAPNDRVEKFTKDNIASQHNKESGAKLLAEVSAGLQYLGDLQGSNDIRGYVYTFEFGHQIMKGYSYTPPHYNDQRIIKDDKSYAKKQAEKYHLLLKENKITPQNVYKEIKKDARLSIFGQSSLNNSTYFRGITPVTLTSSKVTPDNQEAGYGGSLPRSVHEDIEKNANKLNKGVNSIKSGTVLADATIEKPTDKDYKESYYYFIYLENASTGNKYEQYKKALKNLPASYKGL